MQEEQETIGPLKVLGWVAVEANRWQRFYYATVSATGVAWLIRTVERRLGRAHRWRVLYDLTLPHRMKVEWNPGYEDRQLWDPVAEEVERS